MILTVSIGNQTVSFAFFQKEQPLPLCSFRIAAQPSRTADEYAALLCAMPKNAAEYTVSTAILASVVPLLTDEITKAIQLLYPKATCLTVGAGLRSGLTLRTDTPAELGADLVAMAAGAVALEAAPLLVLHCADITTLSAIGKEKNGPVFLGCAILPSPRLSAGALKAQAALLSTVSLSLPSHAIGKNTADSLRAGILLGHAAATQRLIDDFEAEMQQKELPLFVTGEDAEQILPLLRHPYRYEKELLHRGLYQLALLNATRSGHPRKKA